jgi:hypothetical protein
MTARRCFNLKIKTGRVSARAGKQLLEMLDAFEQDAKARIGDDPDGLRAAARSTSMFAAAEAKRRADLLRRSIIAQTSILEGVKAVSAGVAQG